MTELRKITGDEFYEILRLHELWLQSTEEEEEGERADFTGVDLRDADLFGARLKHAYLRGADLTGADLRGACFRQADLSMAKILHLTKKEFLKLVEVTPRNNYISYTNLDGVHFKPEERAVRSLREVAILPLQEMLSDIKYDLSRLVSKYQTLLNVERKNLEEEKEKIQKKLEELEKLETLITQKEE